ncbi:thiamine diphosphokinase [Lentibacillus sp. CBA3610]|uniref:thiamine diphosphokinase n=1 Tax=Lentibacillus sp. CBA3610 TaxID=2518176 RepID=UPI0020D236EF|nr:thiamine diphosphokinase [Lentibacillus sp. CBA3610]
MTNVAIMGSGPQELIPDLSQYEAMIDIWIGADRGALTLLENNITPDYAVGDFDSMDETDKGEVRKQANVFDQYPDEKDETDLEIALNTAYVLNPKKIYLLGATGGRLDHGLINIQLLHAIMERGIQGIIADHQNLLELTHPGNYEISHDYPAVLFLFVSLGFCERA